jgi:hypothetical protein|tara:strand:- start:3973 stop:4545 length:573 start_codon:yes stop_codon:yes gene_type:complete
VQRYVDEIVRRLPVSEYESYVYCRRRYVEEFDTPDTHQLFVPSLRAPGAEAFSHSFFGTLDSLRYSYDLVHFQALGPALFSFIPRARGARIVGTIHGLDWQRAKWGTVASSILKQGERMMARTSSAVVGVSRRLQRYFQDKYGTETFYIPLVSVNRETFPSARSTGSSVSSRSDTCCFSTGSCRRRVPTI